MAGLVGLEGDHVPVASHLTAGDMRTREGARRSRVLFFNLKVNESSFFLILLMSRLGVWSASACVPCDRWLLEIWLEGAGHLSTDP